MRIVPFQYLALAAAILSCSSVYAATLEGGAVAGGESLGEWPGLEDASLFQGRDLYPKNDVLQLFAQIMQSHFGLPSAIIESTIFPSTISAADRLLA